MKCELCNQSWNEEDLSLANVEIGDLQEFADHKRKEWWSNYKVVEMDACPECFASAPNRI